MTHPYDQLHALLKEIRHLKAEPRRSGAESAWLRRHETRLAQLRERFETLAERWLDDEREQRDWLAALHDDAPIPTIPELGLPPVFKGRTKAGAEVIVRPRLADADTDFELVVDGDLVERMPAPVAGIAGTRWHMTQNPIVLELTDCPDEALDALDDYRANPAGGPPWQWAVALYREGLIDENFSITTRGRRMLERLQRAA